MATGKLFQRAGCLNNPAHAQNVGFVQIPPGAFGCVLGFIPHFFHTGRKPSDSNNFQTLVIVNLPGLPGITIL